MQEPIFLLVVVVVVIGAAVKNVSFQESVAFVPGNWQPFLTL